MNLLAPMRRSAAHSRLRVAVLHIIVGYAVQQVVKRTWQIMFDLRFRRPLALRAP